MSQNSSEVEFPKKKSHWSVIRFGNFLFKIDKTLSYFKMFERIDQAALILNVKYPKIDLISKNNPNLRQNLWKSSLLKFGSLSFEFG